jgi:hypothetical protein
VWARKKRGENMNTTNTHQNESKSENAKPDLTGLYQLGGVVALLIVLTALLEIILTFLPGGYASADTVSDWFALFQNNWFLGLRNLGLVNIVMTMLGIPMFFALYTAHRDIHQTSAALALILSFIGVAVFYATNRAFPMLDLSNQYAAATTEAQRTILLGAGQAMLSVGESHTPGTFIGFFLSEVAGILMSIVMLRSKVFNKPSAYFGILGFSLLLIFEICSSFVPALSNVALIFAMSGGLLSMAWYLLIASRLFQLGQNGKG